MSSMRKILRTSSCERQRENSAEPTPQLSSAMWDDQRGFDDHGCITPRALWAICTTLQALPIALARGSIRRQMNFIPDRVNGRFVIHHLIPIEFATHDILFRMKGLWDQNDPDANGIALPTSHLGSLATKLPYHAGPHPQYSRCVEASLDRMAKYRDGTGWTSEQLLRAFTPFVADVRAAILKLAPGESVNSFRFSWTMQEPEH